MYTANLNSLLDLIQTELPSTNWKTASKLKIFNVDGSTLKNNSIGCVKQNEDSYQLAFDVIGHPKENISIDIENNTLIIKADTKLTEDSVLTDLISSFNHSIRIPLEFDLAKTTAEIDLGILLITIPKKEDAKPKKISIKIK